MELLDCTSSNRIYSTEFATSRSSNRNSYISSRLHYRQFAMIIDSAVELVMAIVEGLINNVELLVDAALQLVKVL